MFTGKDFSLSFRLSLLFITFSIFCNSIEAYYPDYNDITFSDCVWTSKYADHTDFDLRPLVAKTGNEYHSADQLFTYYMNVCTNSYRCGHNDVLIGQVLGQQCIPIAKWTRPEWDLIDPARPEIGPQMTFHTGDAGGCPAPRTATVQFHCDPRADPAGYITVHEDPKIKCNYIFVFPTIYGCPGHVLTYSTGTTWLLGGLVVTLLYLIIGCFIKYKWYGKTGYDMVPNIDFWRELPNLTYDGWVFFRNCCGSCLFGICKKAPSSHIQDYPNM